MKKNPRRTYRLGHLTRHAAVEVTNRCSINSDNCDDDEKNENKDECVLCKRLAAFFDAKQHGLASCT